MRDNIHACISHVARHFKYRPDPYKTIDTWSVMKFKDGNYSGDCEDFALTVLWYYFGQNFFRFFFNIFILHSVGLYHVKTKNGVGHFVCRVEDLWFDNFTMKPLPKKEFFEKTKHKMKLRYILPIMIFQPILGYFKR